jgi:hypothetical protein
MSGARRLMRHSAVALTTVLLTLAAGPAPVESGRGGPRPATTALRFASQAAAPVAVIKARRGDDQASVRDSALGSQANVEERPGDDVEAEVVIDRAPITPDPRRIDGTRDALAALDARTRRPPYLLTAHLRF